MPWVAGRRRNRLPHALPNSGGQRLRGRLFQQGGTIAGRTAQDALAAALDGLGDAPVCDDRLNQGPRLGADSRRLGARLIRVPPGEIGAMRGRQMIRQGMDGTRLP